MNELGVDFRHELRESYIANYSATMRDAVLTYCLIENTLADGRGPVERNKCRLEIAALCHKTKSESIQKAL